MPAKHLHNVFFTLEDSSPERIASLLRDCHTYLKPQIGIESFVAGERATDCNRDVNDVDFHVALTILFRDRASHDAYQVNESHNAFVERHKENWADVRVCDSTVNTV